MYDVKRIKAMRVRLQVRSNMCSRKCERIKFPIVGDYMRMVYLPILVPVGLVGNILSFLVQFVI